MRVRRQQPGPRPAAGGGRSRGSTCPADVERQLAEQRIVEAAARAPGVRRRDRLGGTALAGRTVVRRGGRATARRLAAGHSGHRAQATSVVQTGVRVSAERLGPGELHRCSTAWRLTTHVRSVCFEMRYAAQRAAGGRGRSTWPRTADLVSIERGWRATPRPLKWLDRDPAAAARRSTWPTRTAGHPQESQHAADLEVGRRASLGRCATSRSSTATGRHIGDARTCSMWKPASWGSTTAPLHLAGSRGGRRTFGARMRFARVGPRVLHHAGRGLGRSVDQYRAAGWSRPGPVRGGWPRADALDRRPPPWWTPTTTVAQRRALTDEQRARLRAATATG